MLQGPSVEDNVLSRGKGLSPLESVSPRSGPPVGDCARPLRRWQNLRESRLASLQRGGSDVHVFHVASLRSSGESTGDLAERRHEGLGHEVIVRFF